MQGLASAHAAFAMSSRKIPERRSVSTPPIATSSHPLSISREEDEIHARIVAKLEEMCEPRATPIHRDRILIDIFSQLHGCSPKLKLSLLEILASLLERRPAIITGCHTLLPLVIRQINILASSSRTSSDDNDTLTVAIQCKLFWMVGIVGREHLTVKDLNRLFRIFRRVVEREAPPLLCRLLLSALGDMASSPHSSFPSIQSISPTSQLQPSRSITSSLISSLASVTPTVLSTAASSASTLVASATGTSTSTSTSTSVSLPPYIPPPAPESFFEFSGIQSALILPKLDKWPCTKGYTICMWLRWESTAATSASTSPRHSQSSFPSSTSASILRPRLGPTPAPVSASSNTSYGVLYSFLTAKGLGLELSIHKASGALRLKVAARAQVQELVTEVHLTHRKWHCLNITHIRPKSFLSRSTGHVYITVDDELRHEGELTWPQVTDALTCCSIGASTLDSRPGTAFQGRIGTIYFFNKPLSREQTQLLARKSSDFCITATTTGDKSSWMMVNFVKSSISTLFHTLTNSSDTSPLDTYRDMFKHLFSLYHPKCVEQRTVMDTSPIHTKTRPGYNAMLTGGVQVCLVHNVCDVLHACIGGIQSLFPLFLHIDALSPVIPSPSTSTPSKLRSSSSLLPLIFRTLALMLRDSPANQQTMLDIHGFAIIGYLLSRTSSHHLTEHCVHSIEELLSMTSWQEAITSGTNTGLTSTSASGDDPSHSQLQINTSISLSRATEHTLFNDLFCNILMSFEIWMRTEIPFTVQCDVVALIKMHVQKQPKYFRLLTPPRTILDSLRRHLSYSDLFDQHTSSSSYDMMMALHQRRLLRREWMEIVRDLLLSEDRYKQRNADGITLLQMLTEWSNVDSLALAELIELLTELIYAAPELYASILTKAGGACFFLSLLQRHASYIHVQIAVIHMIGAAFRFTPNDPRTDMTLQQHVILTLLQDILMNQVYTVVTYHAMMELILGLPPGAIGVVHGPDYVIERLHELYQHMAPPPSASSPRSTPQPSSTSSSRPSSPIPISSLLSDAPTSTSIRIPSALPTKSHVSMWKHHPLKYAKGIEIILTLARHSHLTHPHLSDDDIILHSTSPTPHTLQHYHSHLIHSTTSMSLILCDLDVLLMTSSNNCQLMLTTSSSWAKPLVELLDWGTPPPINPTIAAVQELDIRPERILSIDEAIEQHAQATSQPTTSTETDTKSTPPSSVTPSIPLLASKLLETLLHHALVYIPHGWQYWRDTFIYLRFIADHMEVNEERYRIVRRTLLVALIQQISHQHDEKERSIIQSNLVYIIDMLEEIIYLESQYRRDLGFKLVTDDIPQRTLLAEPEMDDHTSTPQPPDVDVETKKTTLTSLLAGMSTVADHMITVPSALPVTTTIPSTSPSPSPRQRSPPVSPPIAYPVNNTTSTSSSPGLTLTVPKSDDAPVERISPSSYFVTSSLISTPTAPAENKNPASPRSPNGEQRERSGSWVMMCDESDESELRSDGVSVASIQRLRQEWILIQELLHCIISLHFSLQPVRAMPTSSSSNELSTYLDTTNDNGMNVKPGSPLRVILRLLLDCVDSVCDADKNEISTSTSQGTSLRQLQDILSSIAAVVHVELGIGMYIGSNKSGTSVEAPKSRGWKNRYVLLVLSRLSRSYQHASSHLAISIINTMRQLCNSLKPFAMVSSNIINDGKEDEIEFIPLTVDDTGHLSIHHTFIPSRKHRRQHHSNSVTDSPSTKTRSTQHNVNNNNISTTIPDSPSMSSRRSSPSASPSLTTRTLSNASPTRGQQQENITSTSTAPTVTLPPSIILSSPDPSPSPSSSLTSTTTTPSTSTSTSTSTWSAPPELYQRVLDACLLDVASTVHVFQSLQYRLASDYMMNADKVVTNLRKKLKSEVDALVRCANDLQRQASRSLETYSYSEVNRRAVADTTHANSLQRLADRWNSVQQHLIIEGSPWYSSQQRSKRRYWQIDTVEDGYRMRRKFKLYPYGTDHHKASHSYKERTVLTRRRRKVAGAITAPDDTTPTSDPLVDDDVSTREDASMETSTSTKLNLDEQDADERKRLDMMQRQLSVIGRALTDEDGEEESDVGDLEEEKDDTESTSTATAGEDETTQPPTASSTSNDLDWDLCNDAVTSSTSTTPAPASVVSQTGSVYTSPSCLLVLPICTVPGSLEIGPYYIQFVYNASAEQSHVEPTTELSSSGSLPDRPPKIRPFTLASLDAVRKHAKRDRRWDLKEIVAVYRRRYQLQKTAIEIFLANGKNFFIDLGSRNERKAVLRKLLRVRPPRLIRLCSKPATELLQRSHLTQKWQRREISNFEYLMHLNTISGRTYNDLNQYPVFPWIIQYNPVEKDEIDPDIDIEEVITSGPSHKHTTRVFRDLSKPIGALDPQRLEQILERFQTFYDSHIPPFHYGSHYSNAAIVLFYLMRLEPFASLHIELQAGRFDYPDRLFGDISQTWRSCLTSLSCFKELIPEFFYMPGFLENINAYNLGQKQDGVQVDDVTLPVWARDAQEFVRIQRAALESEYVSLHLHHWIDLIFGYKQKGPEAVKAHNLYFHLTYEGAIDLSTITDPVLLEAAREQIACFGQTPLQLFKRAHPQRQPLSQHNLSRLMLNTGPHRPTGNDVTTYLHPYLQKHLVYPPFTTTSPFTHGDITSSHPPTPQSTLLIAPFLNKLYTISSEFTLGAHLWQPEKPSVVSDQRDGQSKQRQYNLPFTYACAVTQPLTHAISSPTSQSICFSYDGRLLFVGNNWDDSLRVYAFASNINTEAIRFKDKHASLGEIRCTLSQHLIRHSGRITCLALGRDEKTLVTGSMDCTLMIWEIAVEEPSRVSGMFSAGRPYVRSHPRHILRGHSDPIAAVSIDSELDVCLSVSIRGTCLVHSLRKGTFLMKITIPVALTTTQGDIAATTSTSASASSSATTSPVTSTPSSPTMTSRDELLSPRNNMLSTDLSIVVDDDDADGISAQRATLCEFTCEGQMVFYSRVVNSETGEESNHQLSTCNVNGRHWRYTPVEHKVTALCVNNDGKLIGLGSITGEVCLRRVHDLHVVQRFERLSGAITSLVFSYEQDYLMAGTDQGQLAIFAVKC